MKLIRGNAGRPDTVIPPSDVLNLDNADDLSPCTFGGCNGRQDETTVS